MTMTSNLRRVAMAALATAALATLCGCDLGLGGLGDTSLYDATGVIQSVNDYRQDVYDNANAAWDEYIRG